MGTNTAFKGFQNLEMQENTSRMNTTYLGLHQQQQTVQKKPCFTPHGFGHVMSFGHIMSLGFRPILFSMSCKISLATLDTA